MAVENLTDIIQPLENYIRAISGLENVYNDSELPPDEKAREEEDMEEFKEEAGAKLKSALDGYSNQKLKLIIFGLAATFGDTSTKKVNLRLRDLEGWLEKD